LSTQSCGAAPPRKELRLSTTMHTCEARIQNNWGLLLLLVVCERRG